jgi:hypothetical protein
MLNDAHWNDILDPTGAATRCSTAPCTHPTL